VAGKIGEGHAAAMARLGLRELRNAFNPSKESVADNEVGLYGNSTQGEIAAARSGPGQGAEQESHGLDELRAYAKERAQQAEKDMGKDRDNDRDGQDRGGMER
jgi:hypothetical protein